MRDEVLGRERHYTLELSALAELEAFLGELRAPAIWARRFMALETEVHRTRRARKQQRAAEALAATEATARPRAQKNKETA